VYVHNGYNRKDKGRDMKVINKDWGHELCIVNTELYCYKVLYTKDGNYSSNGKFHMHLKKDETFIVEQGVLQLEIADLSQGHHPNCVATLTLKPDDTFRIKPRTPHRFKSYGDHCLFAEVSTHDSDEDSIRGTLEELHRYLFDHPE
jgi:mannose-6-phosphate isomerase-like protein (cupin superfamily)